MLSSGPCCQEQSPHALAWLCQTGLDNCISIILEGWKFHQGLAVGGSAGKQGPILLTHAWGRRQAQAEDGAHDEAGVVRKIARLCDFEPVKLYDRQVLIIAHVHAAQKCLRHLSPERRLRKPGWPYVRIVRICCVPRFPVSEAAMSAAAHMHSRTNFH